MVLVVNVSYIISNNSTYYMQKIEKIKKKNKTPYKGFYSDDVNNVNKIKFTFSFTLNEVLVSLSFLRFLFFFCPP